MEAPANPYTGNNPLIRHAADVTVNLTNRAAWTAIRGILTEAGVPSTDRAQARVAVWAARKRLRRRRQAADLSQMS